MFCYRITKFDPALRDETGAYKAEGWTSISDIGKSFSNRVLTFEDYLDVEDSYVFSAFHFFNDAGFKNIRIQGLEQNGNLPGDIELSGIHYNPKDFCEGMRITGSNLPLLCRLILREILWCRLESESEFFIHFGYDYYMYIGTYKEPRASIDFAERLGLFVEEMESPYRADG